MAVDSGNMLTEAIAAVRVGERARAREILSKLLRADSQNAEYWVWMSSVWLPLRFRWLSRLFVGWIKNSAFKLLRKH